jgi:hypothetical protein
VYGPRVAPTVGAGAGILVQVPAGSWTPVYELCNRAGGAGEPIKAELNAAWLPAPGAAPGYTVVVFFDDDTKWSLTAEYNVARLPGQAGMAEAG